MKFGTLVLTAFLVDAAARAQDAYRAPADVAWRKANIMSEGTRMSAEVFTPKSARADQKLPVIIMAHGWGGVVANLRREAATFARNGFFVVAFDYRGWGESDSRVILTAPEPAVHPDGRFTAEVKELREVVDPIDMVTDWFNAIHWTAGEPQADMNHLGLWGSSFSGGLVVYVAEYDMRVKAIHSQVGSLDGRWVLTDAERHRSYEDSTKRARGEIGYPAPGAKELGNLRGAPIRSKFMWYAPVDHVEKAPNCAMQFLIAEQEELFDNRDNVLKAYPRVKGPKNLVIIPKITHYGIYYEARDQAEKLAVDWFNKYLK
ncbi:MAG TPA: alpha/beta fold hydrolase [Bryobacteraceae bacterium]|nr:alpha/beta fold hydrolase [Bryobacteraceae bacterium]